MLDTGFKQVVINEGSNIVAETIDAVNYINIAGYGKFVVGSSTLNQSRPPENKVKGTTTITGEPNGWSPDQVWEIKLLIKYGLGEGGTGDIEEIGQIVHFQVARVTSIPALFTFEDMLQVSVDEFDSQYITFDGTTFSFIDGYEGYTITNVTATKIYDPQSPSFDDRNSIAEVITGIVSEGYFGFGYPRQIEDSVRNSTPYTAPQYSIQFGGNDKVDFINDARYTEVTWFTKKDHYDGKNHPDMLGYGDANTQTSYDDRKYSVYIKSEDVTGQLNAAEITLLKTI